MCKKQHFRSSSSSKQNNELRGLSELNEKLEHFSYIEGYSPTKADLSVMKHIVEANLSLSKYPHVSRWYYHMSSFSEAERLSLPEAKSSSEAPILKSSEVRHTLSFMHIPTSLSCLKSTYCEIVGHSKFAHSDNHCLCMNVLI